MIDIFRVSQYPWLEYDCSKLQFFELIFDQAILGYYKLYRILVLMGNFRAVKKSQQMYRSKAEATLILKKSLELQINTYRIVSCASSFFGNVNSCSYQARDMITGIHISYLLQCRIPLTVRDVQIVICACYQERFETVVSCFPVIVSYKQ